MRLSRQDRAATRSAGRSGVGVWRSHHFCHPRSKGRQRRSRRAWELVTLSDRRAGATVTDSGPAAPRQAVGSGWRPLAARGLLEFSVDPFSHVAPGCKGRIHCCPGSLLAAGHEMGIGAQGEAGVAVAEVLGHSADRFAGV